MYTLELDTGKWYDLVLRGKKVITEKKKRRRKDKKTQDGENEEGDCDEEGEEEEEDMDVEEEVKHLKIEGNKTDSTESSSSPKNEETTFDDGVFKVTVGPQTTSQSGDGTGDSGSTCMEADIFMPRPRMNAMVTVKNNQLFLYGGLYEEGDKQITLDDMYSLDVQKVEEWNIICKGNVDSQEWQESDSSSDEEEDEDMVSEGTGEDLDLEDAPEIEEEEELKDYFLRTREFWLETASDMLADEAEGMSSGKMRQKAEEIAELYYKSNT
ncbi:kelch domain-containing protein 4-like [Lingula anatina]|uniref:Kelch domain-containing protein 4-like n=1 Tax=Lingula anatina TaxID=7574 RepID=A0A2R2MKV8_LINAN|nr:kelch domain-containing protein 4-like [Lingula anatina]|eukprot:XP_023930856.1 kelch domain-containing protein 4-like [Lingula anatina]